MRAVTLRQPHAALVANQVQRWVTFPRRPRIEVGDGLLIHAGEQAVRSKDVPEGWFCSTDADGVTRMCGPPLLDLGPWLTLHFGAMLAWSRVGDVVPVVDNDADSLGACVQPTEQHHGQRGLIHWHADDSWTDISDQLPFADWSEGWAVRLESVGMLDEPVREYPWRPGKPPQDCWGGADVPEPVELLPVRGRGGIWTPDPGLVKACR